MLKERVQQQGAGVRGDCRCLKFQREGRLLLTYKGLGEVGVVQEKGKLLEDAMGGQRPWEVRSHGRSEAMA